MEFSDIFLSVRVLITSLSFFPAKTSSFGGLHMYRWSQCYTHTTQDHTHLKRTFPTATPADSNSWSKFGRAPFLSFS